MTNNFLGEYLKEVARERATGIAGEHAYRPALKSLLESVTGSHAVNEPKKAGERNKPDFVVKHGEVPLVYVEAKDLGIDLNKEEKSEQMRRYFGYAKLVLTNGLEFRFYTNGIPYGEPIIIGKAQGKVVLHIPEAFINLERTLKDFSAKPADSIRNAEHLAQVMGGKAARLRENVKHLIGNKATSTKLSEVYLAVKDRLVSDLTEEGFADMYAQTLTYGLFAARYYDDTADSFSRSEARDLIPPSNPLLQRFFDHIAGAEFERSLTVLVDELCDIFRASDVKKLVHDLYRNTNLFGELEEGVDPIVHFYEDFLREYDPKEKVKRGVFYTPLPVVRFIVKSVNNILEESFDCAGGLADSEKKNGESKVQILDPAVGTGTFLSEIVRSVFETFKGQEGRWPTYAQTELIPRLHGFELMMAPYTIAHLKLSLLLAEFGAPIQSRLNIFLTNSLEPAPLNDGTLFSQIGLSKGLSDESINAGKIKSSNHIMAIVGNPPYAGESSNKEYQGHSVYKFEPNTNLRLKEKNSKWINDDYVKFIRFAEETVERAGEGVVGMITPHGWLENPTFRGMRSHLLKTFSEIYVLDLHGNANKKEKSEDGKADKNVFDIKQGVAIVLALKRADSTNDQAIVKRYDIKGTREFKFSFLKENTHSSINWTQVDTLAPGFEFIVRDSALEEDYQRGFSVNDLFILKNSGIVTKRDNLCIQNSSKEMWEVVQDFLNLDEHAVRVKYNLPADVRDWRFDWAKKDLLDSGPNESNIIPISYRPFDTRYMYYTGRSRGFVGWPVERITEQFKNENYLLSLHKREEVDTTWAHIFVSSYPTEHGFTSSKTTNYQFPLYQYENGTKISNLSTEIVEKFCKIIGNAKPEEIFDYVYASLHSATYRQKYSSLLKRDFPRVVYPRSRDEFLRLTEIGRSLRELHTMQKKPTSQTTYPIPGDNLVKKILYDADRIYINETQYFGSVPDGVWNMHIGSYEPAQKWLKDRKGKILSNSDIEHYQRIISVLTGTTSLMQEVDSVIGNST